MRAADRCLAALNRKGRTTTTKGKAKGSFTRKRAKEEVSSLFRSKIKCCTWKHRFICLAFHDQPKIPTTDTDKDALLEAGLGEKEIEFEDLDISADEFRDLLYEQFPRLREGGGFKFYKCTPNSRFLEPLSTTTLSSPEALKNRVGKTRTYIRPLQRDLDMTAIIDIPGGVSLFVNIFGRVFLLFLAQGEMLKLWKII